MSFHDYSLRLRLVLALEMGMGLVLRLLSRVWWVWVVTGQQRQEVRLRSP